MFAVNSGERGSSLKETYRYWQYVPNGKLTIQFLASLDKITPSFDTLKLPELQNPHLGPPENINPIHASVDRFMDGGNDQLFDIDFGRFQQPPARRKSDGLPTNFISNICLNRIFLKTLEEVDFSMALAGLDYLHDLEHRRRTALQSVAERLQITRYTWRSMLSEDREAEAWVESIQKQEQRIEKCYSDLYIDLRFWTMNMELRAEPFYKPNVIAMLNTLFPPAIKDLPSHRVSKEMLYAHRNSFYRWMLDVEANGADILELANPKRQAVGSGHSWVETRANLEQYLQNADYMINQAESVHGRDSFQHGEVDFFVERKTIAAAPEAGRLISAESVKRPYAEENKPSMTPKSLNKVVEKSSVRAKIFGRRKISTPYDVENLFQLPSTPWVTTAEGKGRGSLSERGSMESTTSFYRGNNTVHQRPDTPTCDAARTHKRSVSFGRRSMSNEFRNDLPYTPEVPSPPPVPKSNLPTQPRTAPPLFAPKFSGKLQSDNGAFLAEPYSSTPPVVKKKSSLSQLFQPRKKKSIETKEFKVHSIPDSGNQGASGLSPLLILKSAEDVAKEALDAWRSECSAGENNGSGNLQRRGSDELWIRDVCQPENTALEVTVSKRHSVRRERSMSSLSSDHEGPLSLREFVSGPKFDALGVTGSSGIVMSRPRKTLQKHPFKGNSTKSALSDERAEHEMKTPKKYRPSSGKTPRKVITAAEIGPPVLQFPSPTKIMHDPEPFKPPKFSPSIDTPSIKNRVIDLEQTRTDLVKEAKAKKKGDMGPPPRPISALDTPKKQTAFKDTALSDPDVPKTPSFGTRVLAAVAEAYASPNPKLSRSPSRKLGNKRS